MSYVSNGGPNRVPLFPAGTTGTSQPVETRGFRDLTVYLTASAALSAGTVIVEEASWGMDQTERPYDGTWSQVASYTLSSVFASTGGQSAQHLPVADYANLRVRIGTTVVGGTLSAALEMS